MDDADKLLWIADRLAEHFGTASLSPADPVETLVLTILSQNTTDTNRDRAYRSLLDAFGTLEATAGQSQDAVAEAIRVGGLHQQKARAILHALQTIQEEQGSLDLHFLRALRWADAMKWLLALPGVGKKTAGIVMLFSFGQPYFPVDTHIRRIALRFGLIEAQSDAHDQLNRLLPKDPDLMQRLHLHLIDLGRSICRARAPACGSCPLHLRCNFSTIQQRTSSEGEP